MNKWFLSVALLNALPALAQNYPNKPITIVVSYAAGGPSDVIARLVGQHMSQTLGQAIIIENVAGAGGTAGAARVARADPDGYTLLIHHIALPAAVSLYKTLPYDTQKAFAPIGLINYGPYLVTTKADLPVKTIQEVITYLKTQGDRATIAHAGIGTGSNMCSMMLQSLTGVKITEVPYRGTGPALNDVVSGQVDMLCDQTTNTLPMVNAGKLKAFAITSEKRIPQVPNLPTMIETGYQGFELGVWHALYAPAGTNQAHLDKLTNALEKAVADVTLQKRFDDFGTFIFPEGQRGQAALKQRLDSDIEKFAKLLKAFGAEGTGKRD